MFAENGALLLHRRRWAIHNFVGRGRERERQIGIRCQRLAFAVDRGQQRIEPRRA
jgi:hypothetical protein